MLTTSSTKTYLFTVTLITIRYIEIWQRFVIFSTFMLSCLRHLKRSSCCSSDMQMSWLLQETPHQKSRTGKAKHFHLLEKYKMQSTSITNGRNICIYGVTLLTIISLNGNFFWQNTETQSRSLNVGRRHCRLWLVVIRDDHVVLCCHRFTTNKKKKITRKMVLVLTPSEYTVNIANRDYPPKLNAHNGFTCISTGR